MKLNAERAVYEGSVRINRVIDPTAGTLRNGGVVVGSSSEVRATHWRAQNGREMFLIDLPRTSVRFIQGGRSNFLIDQGGKRVILFPPPFGIDVGSYGFLLPAASSSACYPSRQPEIRLPSTECRGAKGCTEAVILAGPDDLLGVSVWDEGREVRKPVLTGGHQTGRFHFSSARSLPDSIRYESGDNVGATCTITWRLISQDKGVLVDFDPKSYLAKNYDMNLQANHVRIAPQVTMDHPDPWAVYAKQLRLGQIYDMREKAKAADTPRLAGISLITLGVVVLVSYFLIKRWKAHGRV